MAISKINASNPARSAGSTTNLLTYNSSSNMFTAPSDGYILAQVWGSGTTLSVWHGASSLKVEVPKQLIVYAARGTKWWTEGSGQYRSAQFEPLV